MEWVEALQVFLENCQETHYMLPSLIIHIDMKTYKKIIVHNVQHKIYDLSQKLPKSVE